MTFYLGVEPGENVCFLNPRVPRPLANDSPNCGQMTNVGFQSQHHRERQLESFALRYLSFVVINPSLNATVLASLKMASAKSVAATVLRSNLSRQCRSAFAPRQFQNGLTKAQPTQRAVRPAFVPVRWHSVPPSASSKNYEFGEIKELSSSPSAERLLIGRLRSAPPTIQLEVY